MNEKIIQEWLNTKFQVKVGGPDRFISCFDEENSPRNERYANHHEQQQKQQRNNEMMLINNEKDYEEVETRVGTAPHDEKGVEEDFSNFDLRKSVEELKKQNRVVKTDDEKNTGEMKMASLDFSKMIWDPIICMFFDPQTNTFHFRK